MYSSFSEAAKILAKGVMKTQRSPYYKSSPSISTPGLLTKCRSIAGELKSKRQYLRRLDNETTWDFTDKRKWSGKKKKKKKVSHDSPWLRISWSISQRSPSLVRLTDPAVTFDLSESRGSVHSVVRAIWGLGTDRDWVRPKRGCASSSSAKSAPVWEVRYRHGSGSGAAFRSHEAALVLEDVWVFIAQSLFGSVLLQIGQLFAVYRATPLPVKARLVKHVRRHDTGSPSKLHAENSYRYSLFTWAASSCLNYLYITV